MLNTATSCEFNYEKFFDEIVASFPPSPPLLAPQDFIDHEQGKSDDVVVVGSSPVLLHGDQKEEKHQGMNQEHATDHHEEAIVVVVDEDDDEKRMRKRVCNREASKRARERKQAHLGQLESRVNELKLNKSFLSKRLADITQKYAGAAEENIALKERIEKLRNRVNVGEETFKAILESNNKQKFLTGRIGIPQTNYPPPPPVFAGDHGLRQTSHDLEIHQLSNKYMEEVQPNQQHIITTSNSTEFDGFLSSTTPWDMSLDLDMSQINFFSSS